jgi:NADH:ubiquinone oxidoreductase subunit 6 (subunit J)
VRNLFHAALLLGLCLAGTAGLYLFLQQSYLACLQVVVYLGGILVLVLFATLFSADVMGAAAAHAGLAARGGWAWCVVGGRVAVQLARAVVAHGTNLLPSRRDPERAPDAIGGADAIGDLLVGSWFVPFLLAGLPADRRARGAVATVRRFRRPLEASRHG